MGITNRDRVLLKNVIHCASTAKTKLLEGSNPDIEYVLDESIVKELEKIQSDIRGEDTEYRIFEQLDNIKVLWRKILEKAIKCLRYFDNREPFLKNPRKKPIAYGMDDLKKYFDNYSDFESLLYGGVKYYRDHVIHVFRQYVMTSDL